MTPVAPLRTGPSLAIVLVRLYVALVAGDAERLTGALDAERCDGKL
jgi:hypothetical protein